MSLRHSPLYSLTSTEREIELSASIFEGTVTLLVSRLCTVLKAFGPFGTEGDLGLIMHLEVAGRRP